MTQEMLVFRTHDKNETEWLFNRLRKLKDKTIKINGFGYSGMNPKNRTNIYIALEYQSSTPTMKGEKNA